MTNNLFIGGFPYETTQDELVSLFSKCGTVKSAKILIDRETGRSRGLAFIEMSSELEAADAIAKLDGCMVGARKIFVSEARPQEKKPGGFDAKPGFTERRSGRDRRGGAAGSGEPRREEWKKRPSFGDDRKPFGDRKKTWDSKPGFGADRKPFSERKKSWGDKPGGGKGKPFGGEKKWGGKRPGGGKDFGGKRRFGS